MAARVDRRTVLKGMVAAGLMSAGARGVWGQASQSWMEGVAKYLEGHAREDGGYGWEDQGQSHVTPTFAVIGCYQVMKREAPNREAVAEFVRKNHPLRGRKLEAELPIFEYQQVQSLVWLGGEVEAFKGIVGKWKGPQKYPAQYERHAYPVFQQELSVFFCREAMGMGAEGLSREFVEYVESRRRENGSFNNTPAMDGSDGHVMNTWWGLRALRLLGRSKEKREETVAWLRGCQLKGGGFTYQPKPAMAGIDDVAYTWAAVRALAELGAEPADREGCVRYLHGLWNEDGGFGDRAGWASNPMATYCALDALAALKALEETPARAMRKVAARAVPGDLKVFTIQLEAPGVGGPGDAVELAKELKIHLWGAKNAAPGWIEAAQACADRQGVPVRFFVANEEYGTFVEVPGMGTYSHTSDLFAPAGVDIGMPMEKNRPVSWEEYREKRLAALEKGGGKLFWQFGENEELTRLFLDDSLERGGFAAISTFHFGNPDFTISEPFLYRYRQAMPFVALQDAHGGESWWWSERLAGFRTMFLAKDPTWEGWMEALKNNWVVAVRHDANSGMRTWMHGGAPGVQEFVKEREAEWKWWEGERVVRPTVAMVVIRPEDRFEPGRPEKGVAVRIRCQWEATTQGVPKKQLVELAEVSVDGRKMMPAMVQKKNAQGGMTDHYYLLGMPEVAEGKHVVEATVRGIGSGKMMGSGKVERKRVEIVV